MPYAANLSRSNPSCILYVIDQSGSMYEECAETELTKAQAVADILNQMLNGLIVRCAKGEGIRDYLHVGAIGYGETVESVLPGSRPEGEFLPISRVAANPLRIQEQPGVWGTTKTRVWVDPIAAGETPMCEAITRAHGLVRDWLAAHPDCYPPTIVHLTDGMATDGDPTEYMDDLRSLASTDGPVVLMNVHISDEEGCVQFPNSADDLHDDFAVTLYGSASLLTPAMVKLARADYGLPVTAESRAFVFNGNARLVQEAFQIGTYSVIR